MEETVEQLSNIFPFSVLSKKDIEKIAEDSSRLNLKNSEILFQAGSPSDAFYLVVSGGIKLVRNNPQNGKLILEFFGPGELVIEDGLVENTAHSSEAHPIGETCVLKIDHKTLRKIFDSNPRFLLSWVELIARWLNYYQSRLESMVFMDVESRLISALITLCKKFGKKDQRGTIISVRVTHQDLSEYVAASRETVSLALGGLRRKKLIQSKMRWLVVPDLKALRRRTE